MVGLERVQLETVVRRMLPGIPSRRGWRRRQVSTSTGDGAGPGVGLGLGAGAGDLPLRAGGSGSGSGWRPFGGPSPLEVVPGVGVLVAVLVGVRLRMVPPHRDLSVAPPALLRAAPHPRWRESPPHW